MSTVLEVIENQGLDLSVSHSYAAILGGSPSKGAKSPTLWNAAFKKFGIPGLMHPMDVRPDRLSFVVDRLRHDARFIGGAVTMPYKISIIPHLDEVEPQAKLIGAVNCLYRKGEKLVGTNTDGAAALWSLEQAWGGSLQGKNVLLVGTGGAGLAVATYLAMALGQQGQLKLANRSAQPRKALAQKLAACCRVEDVNHWPVNPDDVSGVDIVVNCSSIGFESLKKDSRGHFSLKFFTPLGPVDEQTRIAEAEDAERLFLQNAAVAIGKNIEHSLEVFAELAKRRSPLVFDIIYQPQETLLLKLARLCGYRTLNGLPMNFEQAVIAFYKTTTSAKLFAGGVDDVRAGMKIL